MIEMMEQAFGRGAYPAHTWDGLPPQMQEMYRDGLRAALAVLARNVSDEMVEAARIALIPALDECHMDDWPEDTKREIRAGISAALSAAGDEDRRA